jgi:ferritin
MLSKNVEKALNAQLAKEAYAANSYLAMATWSETQGYKGASDFFYGQSDEEREHMMKFVKYINASGGHALVPALKEPAQKYDSLKATFEVSLAQEQDVTKSIHELVTLSQETKDYATLHFLQWFVAEQHEEECLFQSILDMFKISEGKNMLLLDREIARTREQAT